MSLLIETFSIGPMDNNLYLLRDDAARELVIVDPSLQSDPALSRVAELVRSGYRVTGIWNTHGHFDHVYDNARWKKAYPVPLLAHPEDVFFLEHLREQAIWFGMEPPEVVLPDGPLGPGIVVAVGAYSPQVLHLPGHSPGSVAFYFAAQQQCIVGDVLFVGSVGRTDLPGSSAPQLAASLRVLWQLPEDTAMLPGHGAATNLGQEIRTNEVAHDLMCKFPAA